ncbi:MAG TPA: nucleotidyltransferase family protein, partial [Thermoanaerobaculia bacterium]|nr:nucleotidyltransferase family protein [Thermoanaerobaculia bacterium]
MTADPESTARAQHRPGGTERRLRRTAERDLLVRAARAALAGEPLAPADLDGVDPARLLAEAHRHECAPLLWSGLAPDGLAGPAAERLPAAERDALRLAYHSNGLRNQVVRERLEALLAELARRGVAGMPLKGVVLAFAGYPVPDQRPLGDLDLLVREADYPAVAEALAAHGYRTDAPPLAPADLPRHAHTVGQVRFAALAREHHLAGAAWLSLQLAAELFDRPDIA